MRVTPWFNGYQKPVRTGMFERFRRGVIEWSWFNVYTGKWGIGMLCSCSSCMEHSRDEGESEEQHCSWRGREAEVIEDYVQFFDNGRADDFGYFIFETFTGSYHEMMRSRIRFILLSIKEEH